MRMNTPVTNNEREFRAGELVVSKTDLRGTITYVNPYFCELSGYSEYELLGQPHNMIRHPDMPAEAFADMWARLQEGRPWTGMVKNRCKNGDHYWVKANATPLRTNGQVVGYMSVRTPASRSEVAAAETIYSEFREGRATGKKIVDGVVQPIRELSPIAQLKALTIKQTLTIAMWVLVAISVAMGAISFYASRQTDAMIRKAYEEDVLGVRELKIVADLYAVSIVDTAHKARAGALSQSEAIASIKNAQQRVHMSWTKYLAMDKRSAVEQQI
jgi:methyl-accepting chemotaxis protein